MLAPRPQFAGSIRPLWRLVWPVLVEQVLVLMVSFSDTVLAGHYLQRPHLAAMAVVSYILWLLTSLFSVVAIGATAMTARYVGAGDWPMANRVTNQSYLAGAVWAVIVMALAILSGNRLLDAMQLEALPAALAARFLSYIVIMLPAMMCEAVGIACLRGAGDMVSGLVTMLMVNVTNIVVSWSLLLGVGPFPKLGWDGVAIGTACGHAVGGLIPLLLLARGRAGLRFHWRCLYPDVQLIRRILRIGVPGGVDVLSVIGCQLAFLSIINHLGALATAAHGVAIRIESLAYLPGYAFQIATATLTGQSLGARDVARASQGVRTAGVLCCGFMSLGAALVYWQAGVLVRLLLSGQQEEVAQLSAALLRIVGFGLPPLALLMVLTGALRGAGDTRVPLIFTLLGFLGVRMPLAYILTHHWNLGVQGAWFAMVTDLVARCLMITARFASGAWMRVEV